MNTSRRRFLAGTGAASLLALASQAHGQVPRDKVGNNYRIQHGRIRQSVMGWCFKPMKPVDLAKLCVEIGIPAIEGISAENYPAVRKLGMQISLIGSHSFKTGPFSKANHRTCIDSLKKSIDIAVDVGCPSVITFTGMRDQSIDDEQGAMNCVDCWKQVIGYAEKQNVNLVLEHLNSRDDTHPMKGHPGYFGDDVDLCVDLIKRVGSPNMKLLFDIYHVQVMNGDVMRRIRMYKDFIGHYHTAGCPGRGELDDTQEINYPAIMRTILETGYTGYVAQEFIPTWDDKAAALRHGAMVCDV